MTQWVKCSGQRWSRKKGSQPVSDAAGGPRQAGRVVPPFSGNAVFWELDLISNDPFFLTLLWNSELPIVSSTSLYNFPFYLYTLSKCTFVLPFSFFFFSGAGGELGLRGRYWLFTQESVWVVLRGAYVMLAMEPRLAARKACLTCCIIDLAQMIPIYKEHVLIYVAVL